VCAILVMLDVSIPEALWMPLAAAVPAFALFIPYWLRRSEAAERESASAASEERTSP